MPVMQPAEHLAAQRALRDHGRRAVQAARTARAPSRCSSMTSEEVITLLAGELSSYRELPQMWYQFQTKLRDEPRPKAGLMRTREFTMKDSYSFDLDAAGLDASFDAHRAAYIRAYERIGIPAIPVAGVQRRDGRLRLDRVHLPVGDRRGRHRPLPRVRVRGEHRGRGVARWRRSTRWPTRPRPWTRPRASTRPACGRSRTWRPATTRPPTGRSRPSSTCSTARSRWCWSAATTPWRSRSSSTRPARSRCARPRRRRSSPRSAPTRARSARSASPTCRSSPTWPCGTGPAW